MQVGRASINLLKPVIFICGNQNSLNRLLTNHKRMKKKKESDMYLNDYTT